MLLKNVNTYIGKNFGALRGRRGTFPERWRKIYSARARRKPKMKTKFTENGNLKSETGKEMYWRVISARARPAGKYSGNMFRRARGRENLGKEKLRNVYVDFPEIIWRAKKKVVSLRRLRITGNAEVRPANVGQRYCKVQTRDG